LACGALLCSQTIAKWFGFAHPLPILPYAWHGQACVSQYKSSNHE